MSNSEKQIYRIEAKRHRERIDIRDEDVDAAVDKFFKTIKPSKDQIVACYWPIKREFDTSELLHRLLDQGIQCCLPVIQKDTKELLFVTWNDSVEMEKGDYDVVQPKIDENTKCVVPDIVVVPMLAFDRQGHRLGYGGGYYDATLKALKSKKKTISVGWAYAQQAVLFNLPAEDHDQVLDFVITPKDVHSFTKDDGI